jgi:hypothetical protein
MKFICERCKTQYDTPEKAMECENSHEVNEKKKAEMNKKISDAVNAYIAKFHEVPEIHIESSNRNFLFPSIRSLIDAIDIVQF